ncbi:MAG: GNAT family N-acetyltransferase [Chloroflexota bacterium]
MIRYTEHTEGVDWEALMQALIADDFHNGRTPEQYRQSFENSYAAVLVFDDDQVIGTARALSDGVCNGYVVDVWTRSSHRRRGIATQMMTLLLSRMPGQHIYLWTDNAQEFYTRLRMRRSSATGFETVVGRWLQQEPE